MKHTLPLKYLISSEQDELWGLKVNSVGFQQINPPTHHPTRYLFSSKKGRILNEYQLLYISEGRGQFISANQKKIPINAGNMFLLFPNEWHNYAPLTETGWNEYWIGFEGVNMDARVENRFFSKEEPIFNVGINTEIIELYRKAIDVAQQQQVGFQQMLGGIVNHLMGIMYSHHKLSAFKNLNVTNQIENAKRIIYEQFSDSISPEEIAEQVNMSYSWFRKVFKEYTGLTPYQYVQEIRIQKSKELSATTQFNSQEIAFKVGFENSDYFCTAFKKRTRYTPIQYRRMIRSVELNEGEKKLLK
mgnify:CR=1 FL=1